jgi:hypothetical protein
VRIADFASTHGFFFSGLGGVLALRVLSIVRLRADGTCGDGVRGASFELLGSDVEIGEAGAKYKIFADESGVIGCDIGKGGPEDVLVASVSVSTSLRIIFLWRVTGPLGNCGRISPSNSGELLRSDSSSTNFCSDSTAKVNLYP